MLYFLRNIPFVNILKSDAKPLKKKIINPKN